jgi:hypothetical protein
MKKALSRANKEKNMMIGMMGLRPEKGGFIAHRDLKHSGQ